MKARLILLFLVLIQLTASAQQSQSKKIKVSDNLDIYQISENSYVHVSYSEIAPYGKVASNGFIFKDKNKAFLFDTPSSDDLTKELVTWIEDSLKVKIVGFVPNHWHEDCMGGLNYLHRLGIPSYAHQMTIDIARSHQLPLPRKGFTGSKQLKINNKLIFCEYLGAAHSLDNIIVWIPSEKILFAGCMVKEMKSTSLGNTADGDLKAYPSTIRKLLEKYSSARVVIPGHGDFGGPELIRHTLQLAEK